MVSCDNPNCRKEIRGKTNAKFCSIKCMKEVQNKKKKKWANLAIKSITKLRLISIQKEIILNMGEKITLGDILDEILSMVGDNNIEIAVSIIKSKYNIEKT